MNRRWSLALLVVTLTALCLVSAVAGAESTSPVNLALQKAVTASSVQEQNPSPEFESESAVDGDPETRWASAYKDNQWLQVDLGQSLEFNSVVIRWEAAYGKEYRVLVSNDAETWEEVHATDAGSGGAEKIVFDTVTARFVRVELIKRATEWGFSIWELGVFNLPEEKPGTESLKSDDPFLAALEASQRAGVVIVRNKWTANFYGATAYDGLVRGATMALDEAGIGYEVISNDDVLEGGLKGYKVAILPSNPSMTEELVAAYRAFVQDGGRLFASYETSMRDKNNNSLGRFQLEDVFKAKMVKWDKDPKKYSYIKVTQPEHPIFAGLDPYIPTTRHMTFVVEPVAGGTVLGTWVNSDKQTPSQASPADAAIIASPYSVFIGENIFDRARTEEHLRKLIVNVVQFLAGPNGLTKPRSKEEIRAEIQSRIDQTASALEEAYARYEEALDSARFFDANGIRFQLGLAKASLQAAEQSFEGGAYASVEESLDRADELIEKAMQSLISSRKVETRAVWLDNGCLARAGGPEGIAELMDKLAAANINVIFPETIYRGWATYESEVVPQDPAFSNWSEDPLEVIVREAHKRGIEVHPWVWVFCVGYWHEVGPVLKEHPEWAEQDAKGNIFASSRFGTAWLNPTLPEVREYLTKQFTEIVTKYEVDGLHLDYIRYNEQDAGSFGYSPKSLEAFMAEHDFDPREVKPWSPKMEIFNEWRRNNVTSFVRHMYKVLKDVDENLLLSAAVVPDPHHSRMNTLQDWEKWLDNRYLDFLVTMAYTDSPSQLGSLVSKGLKATGRKSFVYPGLAIYLNKPDGLLQQIKRVRAHSATGLALFAGAHLTDDFYKMLSEGPFREEALVVHRQPVAAAEKVLEGLTKGVEQLENRGVIARTVAEEIVGTLQTFQDKVGQLGEDDAQAAVALLDEISSFSTGVEKNEELDREVVEVLQRELRLAGDILRAIGFYAGAEIE